MNRRGFLQAILAAAVAPAFIDSKILMPVRQLIVPNLELSTSFGLTGYAYYWFDESRIAKAITAGWTLVDAGPNEGVPTHGVIRKVAGSDGRTVVLMSKPSPTPYNMIDLDQRGCVQDDIEPPQRLVLVDDSE
jgi:hypothetical protein